MNIFLPLLVALPLIAAVPSYVLSKKKADSGLYFMGFVTLIVTALAGWLFLNAWGDEKTFAFSCEGIIGFGLNLKADGFRSLYVLVAGFMWLMTSLFTPQYFAHGHAHGRYALFTLLTLGATVGVFLSDDLITAFMFFEILSFTSYCWVIHEETPGARRAGQTYLAIAILGGMSMLMGLMMLHLKTGSLKFDDLNNISKTLSRDDYFLPGILILIGFGAKAGMFPLHVWLPKAHPVAPAPASALLSGILTKVGVFGILVISSRMFFSDVSWGNLLMLLGLINMFLGALLALFSIDLKRTLACSSMSQIGFILFGIGTQALLGEHNALAAQGTVLHMLNHSLIKLVLFMAAGVIYINTHSLNLNEIRGYGRKRHGLKLVFLIGAASISGIPYFSGYASKTLLHEGIIEYIHHLQELKECALAYQFAEWVFVITGGLTFCYMLKLFISIFVEKHPTKQEEYDKAGSSMTPISAVALGASALLLFVLGLYSEGILTDLANRSLPFLMAHEPDHAVSYLAWVNLSGGLKSLVIGLLLYLFVVRKLLYVKNNDGQKDYINPWPEWLDLENSLYRPVLRMLLRLGTLIGLGFNASEKIGIGLGYVMTFVTCLFDSMVDGISVLLLRTILRPVYDVQTMVPIGNRLTWNLGRVADVTTGTFRKIFGMKPKEEHYYIRLYAHMWSNTSSFMRRLLRTLSFSLILFALGVVLLVAFMLIR
ncbi:MAG: proton-conducting transporter membrane subunit [Bacillota bacterium]|nr:proton-conducting transporter membrane subunit [Bacillota bacterium]